MEALKTDYEKSMTDFETLARQADKEGKPMPKMPEGYTQYKKDRETKEMMADVEVKAERREVSLDELLDTKSQTIPMGKSAPAPSKNMDMSKK